MTRTSPRRRRSSTLTVLAMALLPALLAGCGGDGSTLGPDGTPLGSEDPGAGGPTDSDEPADSSTVTLAQLSAEIFTPTCAAAGCHAASRPAENMPLTADLIAAAIIDVPSNQLPDIKRVDPGNPDGSYLLQKVRGTGAGAQMPIGGVLSDEQIQRIADWIAAGASTD